MLNIGRFKIIYSESLYIAATLFNNFETSLATVIEYALKVVIAL
jgi:hypothetical protein